MIGVLSKSADQITISDIKALTEAEVPEGEQIEFKAELSAKGDGSPDPWMSGKNRIGERAKNTILEEVVAFANAHGGILLLGIKESDTKPAVAAAISPLPRCTDLAERLKLVFRDCVEPQLSRLEVFAVPTEDDGGVIVIRSGRSRLAPHRVTTTLVCPVRRSDRCEKMTMREIQDMTLNVSRGLERLEKRLSERSARFQQEFKRLKTSADAFGIRMTAAPIGDDIRFERVFHQHSIVEELDEPWRNVLYRPGSGSEDVVENVSQSLLIFPKFWRPMLRAARAEPNLDQPGTGLLRNSYREIHCDGLIELGFIEVRQYNREGRSYPSSLSPNLLISMFANLAVWADRVRHQASIPTAEYALEVEICVKGGPVRIRNTASPEAGRLQPNGTIFPRYSLGSRDEFSDLLRLFDRDFRNSYGEEIQDDQGTYAIQGL